MRISGVKLVLLAAALLLLFVFGYQRVSWQSSLLDTLPVDANPAHQAFQASQQPNEHQLFIWLKIPSAQAQDLKRQLRTQTLPELKQATPAIIPNQQLSLDSILDYYQAHAGNFATNDALKQLKREPQQTIAAAQRRLQQPSPIWVNIAEDPLLLTQKYVEQLPDALTGFNYDQPLYVRSGAQFDEVLLALNSAADALSQRQSQQLIQHLEVQLQSLSKTFPELEIARSGLAFHASAAANQASYEMSLFGGLSLAFVVLMLLWVFRSIRHLLFTLATLGVSTVVGLTAVLLVFNEPHVLMLVFATTLIGLCIDYVFHASIAASQGVHSWRKMVPALWLGGLTTILGYLLLTQLSLPLLQQLGVFMAAALLCMLTLVVIVIPRWNLLNAPSPSWQKVHAQLARRYHQCHFRGLPLLLIAGAFTTASTTAYYYHSNDSVRQLASSPQHLLDQEQRVREVTQAYFDADVLLITGATETELHTRYAQVASQLPQWQQQQLITRWQSLFDYIQPEAHQQEVQDALDGLWKSAIGQDYLAWLGVSNPSREASVTELTTHPLYDLFVYRITETTTQPRYMGVIRLAGVQHQELAAQLAAMPHVELFNPLQHATNALAEYRSQLERWLLALLAIAWVVLLIRIQPKAHWRTRMVLSTQVIAVMTIALSSSLLIAMLTQALNVFHWVGAILVLVLGLDYGIFCASQVQREHVLQAISLSALTTILAFGALSFSTTPAIAAFGQVVLWGVLISALLTPFIQYKATNDQ